MVKSIEYRKVVLPLNLKTKLILILSLVLIVSFVGENLVSYYTSKKALSNDAAEEILPLIADRIHNEMRREVLQYIKISSAMAHDTFVKNWILKGEKNTEEIVEYLHSINEKFGFSSTFLVSDRTKKYYYYNGVFKEVSPENAHDVWYYDFLALNTEYDLDVDHDEISQGTLTVFINHRLEDDNGNLLGVVGIGIEMKNVGETMARFEKEYNRSFFLVDLNGVVQIHSDESKIETSTIHDFPELSHLSESILSGNNEKQLLFFKSKYNGEKQFISSRYFPDIDWFLIVIQNESSVLTDIRTALFFSLLVGFAATFFVVLVTVWTVNRYQGRLEVMATTDSLTGLFNRRYFMTHVEKELSRAERTERTLSLVLLDVDRFKRINDTFGHSVGDKVLRDIAKLLSKDLRKMDILSRVGGEEFAMLLPETTAEGAREVAERIRTSVEKNGFNLPKSDYLVTISAGIAANHERATSFKMLYNHADKALYEAKKRGRNKVCIFNKD